MSLPPAARDSAPEVAIFQVDKSVSGATHQEGNEEMGRGARGATWRPVSLVLQSVLPRGPAGAARGSKGGEVGGGQGRGLQGRGWLARRKLD